LKVRIAGGEAGVKLDFDSFGKRDFSIKVAGPLVGREFASEIGIPVGGFPVAAVGGPILDLAESRKGTSVFPNTGQSHDRMTRDLDGLREMKAGKNHLGIANGKKPATEAITRFEGHFKPGIGRRR
jgi:hypothetical protein